MNEASAVLPIPEHVPASRVRDIDVYEYAVEDGDVQRALYGFRDGVGPETFWSPYNGGHWVVTRAATIDTVISDAERFSNRYIGVPKELNPTQIFRPFQMDPPESVPYRRLIARGLSPRVVKAMTDDARKLTVELIEGFKPAGGCEFVTEFAQHMPIRMFMSILDLPESHRTPLLDIAERIARPTTPDCRMQGYADLDTYSLDLIAERRESGEDDFIGLLCLADIDGRRLSDQELCGIIALVMIAGLDTVAGMLGFVVRFLARNPEQRHELMDHPELIPGAVEELLRRHAHVQLSREARADVELDGVLIRKGDMVVAPLSLYSLDETVFANPLEVDFQRPRKPAHVAFGGPSHRCLGALLARTELQIFTEEWLARIPEFDTAPGVELSVRTRVTAVFLSLPLVWPVE